MSKRNIILIIGIAVISTVLFSINASKISADDNSVSVEHGKHLVDLGNCNFCHTPKVMTETGMDIDLSRLLSGHQLNNDITEHTASATNVDGEEVKANFHLTRWSGPWGISFAANLTPDEETGIGLWTEDMFIGTIRNGKHMGSGRDIQLPMPWKNLSHLTDDDLKSMFAYLQSIKPIKNKVPEQIASTKK